MTTNFIISIFDSIPVWVMILPILLCSVFLLAIVIERLLFFRNISIDYRLLVNSVVDHIRSKKISAARNLCAGYRGPLVEIITTVLDRWQSADDRELVISDASEKSIRKIERFGGSVSTISTISPMLGLLGTVTGMMKSFSSLSQMGPSARDLLAQGITEALITTALGLMVAIPSIIFYNYMVSKIEFYIREVEYIANNLNEAPRTGKSGGR